MDSFFFILPPSFAYGLSFHISEKKLLSSNRYERDTLTNMRGESFFNHFYGKFYMVKKLLCGITNVGRFVYPALLFCR